MNEAEFDRFADEYRAQHATSIRLSGEEPEFFAQYKIDDVASVLREEGVIPSRILDFGGGVGNSLGFMRMRFPQSEIVLLDPSKKSIEIAQERWGDKAEFRQFDGTRVPYPDASFDLVFAACVFHHIPAGQHVPLFRELKRVLISGGSIFVFEHNPYNPLTVGAVRNCPFDENAALITARVLQQRFDEAGLTGSRIRYRMFFPRPLAALRRLEKYLVTVPLGAQYFAYAVKSSG